MKSDYLTIIIDDDATMRASLEMLCAKADQIKVVGSFASGIDGIQYIKQNEVDLVLLDLEMPDISGWDVLKLLDNHPEIIVVTSNAHEAVKGYSFQINDFLVKPVKLNDFLAAINRFKSKSIKLSQQTHIVVKSSGSFHRIRLSDIAYIKSLADYVELHYSGNRIIVHSTLKQMLDQLPSHMFQQTHRSVIVNTDKVSEVQNDTIVIQNNELPISKSHKEALFEKLGIS